MSNIFISFLLQMWKTDNGPTEWKSSASGCDQLMILAERRPERLPLQLAAQLTGCASDWDVTAQLVDRTAGQRADTAPMPVHMAALYTYRTAGIAPSSLVRTQRVLLRRVCVGSPELTLQIALHPALQPQTFFRATGKQLRK
jgi:hypothetical protein